MSTSHTPADQALPGETGDQRYLVVSSDSHTGPLLKEQLREYCDDRYLEDFDRFTAEAEIQNELPVLNEHFPDDLMDRRRWNGSTKGLIDANERLRDMDESGIAASVLYHGGQNGQEVPFSTSAATSAAVDYSSFQELEAVGIHIYNRWLADFVSVAPDRLVGSVHIPVHDVDASIKEIEWARSVGLTAVNLPAPRRDFTTYEQPQWDPFWEACAANEMVLNTHAGAGDSVRYLGPAANALFMMEMNFYARRAAWLMILSGVFERFPTLKLVLTEQSNDWITATLSDMDSVYHSYFATDLRRVLPREPSSYWQTNCFVGASFMSGPEARAAVEQDLVDSLMWGDDYPHLEGTWPRTREAMQATFHGIEPSAVARLIGENAVGVYGLDREALGAIAERVGPTHAELAVAPNRSPDDFGGLAFRVRGKFS